MHRIDDWRIERLDCEKIGTAGERALSRRVHVAGEMA